MSTIMRNNFINDYRQQKNKSNVIAKREEISNHFKAAVANKLMIKTALNQTTF